MFTEEMINRVFGFIDPIIQALRVKFPLVESYAITVYLRTGQYVTFPPQVIANTPFCEMGRKGYARLWEAVAEEASNRGYQVETLPPNNKHPYVVCLRKTFED